MWSGEVRTWCGGLGGSGSAETWLPAGRSPDTTAFGLGAPVVLVILGKGSACELVLLGDTVGEVRVQSSFTTWIVRSLSWLASLDVS